MVSRSKLLRFLSNEASYSHKPKTLKHIQTHISDIFIVSPYVYKVKKPVNFRFLDFSTLSKRKYYCDREIKLNRRLSEYIYLEVVPISIRKGKLFYGKGENIVEYAVKMKRLPAKYFLKELLKKGKVQRKDLSRVVEKLSDFYEGQKTKKEINRYGRPDRMKFNIDENFRLTKKYIGNTISTETFEVVKFYNEIFFKKRSHLFRERIKSGLIKDCHGDLHLEHIIVTPNDIYIFDCIEFNNRFRYIDIASDIAFLSMDLDYNGYSNFGDFVVSEVAKKLKDKSIFKIIPFYKCYRAYVRGKVESLRADSPGLSAKESDFSLIRAKKYFNLALKYSLFGQSFGVIVVFGLIGTGKSTIAESLSDELCAKIVSSDRVRKELTRTDLHERGEKEFKKGIYTRRITKKTYKEMTKRCIEEIKSGNTVILDASYSKKNYRKEIIKKTKELGVSAIFIQTVASKSTIKSRLSKREIEGTSVSDATWKIFNDFKRGFEEPGEIPNNKYIKLNTNKNPQQLVLEVLKQIVKLKF